MMIYKPLQRHASVTFLLLGLCACSGLEKSEQDKIKKMHALSEPILRFSQEKLYTLKFPEQKVRERYSWENTTAHHFPKITKEAFRCKGAGHPQLKMSRENVALFDCQGPDKHSLPIVEDKEAVYPALLEILNGIQDHLKRKVVVTAGHRCYQHQTYLLGTTSGAITKYLIGAQVDFLVEGVSLLHHSVIDCLQDYYNKTFGGDKEYVLEKSAAGVWQNKEIALRYVAKHEGRNEDNSHEYPYFSLELKYDRSLDKKIQLNPQHAMKCYYRF
jgi:hypothetical protein